MREIENLSWAPVWNRVHPSEFVFQKSQAIVSDFSGIQTHEGELHSARVPMINSISSTMFFFCDNFTKTLEITPKSSGIKVRGPKSQVSVEKKLSCHGLFKIVPSWITIFTHNQNVSKDLGYELTNHLWNGSHPGDWKCMGLFTL